MPRRVVVAVDGDTPEAVALLRWTAVNVSAVASAVATAAAAAAAGTASTADAAGGGAASGAAVESATVEKKAPALAADAAGGDADAGGQADADASGDADVQVGGNTDAEAKAEMDVDADAKAEVEAEAEATAEAEVQAEVEAEAEAEAPPPDASAEAPATPTAGAPVSSADKEEVVVTILHATMPPYLPIWGPDPLFTSDALLSEILAEDRRRSVAAAAALRAHAARLHLPAVVVTRPGDPREVVPEYIDKAGADLLVVGSRGLSGLRKLLLGSVSSYLVSNVGCPVVVYRPAKEEDDA